MAVPHFSFTTEEQKRAKSSFADVEKKQKILSDMNIEDISLLGGWCAEKNFMKVVKQKIADPNTVQLIINDHKQMYREIERHEELTASLNGLSGIRSIYPDMLYNQRLKELKHSLAYSKTAIQKIAARVVQVRVETQDL